MDRKQHIQLGVVVLMTLIFAGLSAVSWAFVTRSGPLYRLVAEPSCCCGHWDCGGEDG